MKRIFTTLLLIGSHASVRKSTKNNLRQIVRLAVFLYSAKPFTAFTQSNLLFSRYRNFQTMSERWELDFASHRSTFLISPYKPVYVTAGRWSNSPNQHPASENPVYTLPYIVGYNNYECKFQLSLKTKVAQGLFFNHGRELLERAIWQRNKRSFVWWLLVILFPY